jgi:hypothetical protein
LFIALGTIKSIFTACPNFLKEKKTIVTAAIIFILGISVHFYLIPFRWATEASIIQNIVNSSYLVFDIFILLLTAVLLWKIIGTTFSKAWLFIAFGNISIWFADIYSILNIDSYSSGDSIDIVYKLGFIFYAFGFILLKETAEKELSVLPESPAPTTHLLSEISSEKTEIVKKEISKKIPKKTAKKKTVKIKKSAAKLKKRKR